MATDQIEKKIKKGFMIEKTFKVDWSSWLEKWWKKIWRKDET